MTEEEARARMHKFWAESRAVFKSTFLGIRTLQHPIDTWIIQEIISETKPDVILECGTFKGGSALLWAFLLEMINPAGRVISVDIQQKKIDPEVLKFDVVKKRVEFIEGSSIDPAIVKAVTERVRDRKLLVILDSAHSVPHVLEELRAYAPMVPVGSYIIVQDVWSVLCIQSCCF